MAAVAAAGTTARRTRAEYLPSGTSGPLQRTDGRESISFFSGAYETRLYKIRTRSARCSCSAHKEWYVREF